ncbi:MAG TPA: ribokinase [Silvibacterium sp.]|nr:ribokinase [Silvibacterium sp.]
MKRPIVVVGSINLDLVARADRLPQIGETIAGRDFHSFQGGKGANQAVAAARLGCPVAIVGCVGSDTFGAQLRGGLEAAGVDTSCVTTVDGPSGTALITTGGRGENTIVVAPGANGLVDPAQLEKAIPLIERAGILLAQLEIPLETVTCLAEIAERRNIPLILDPAPARELPRSLLRRICWITPNETETQILLGRITTVEATDAAADTLLTYGVKNVLLKLGLNGCIIAEGNHPKEHIPAFAVDAVDTTAAGDAFNAGFAVGLMREYTVRDSARFASAVAALSVTRAGAQSSMPSADEVERFMEQREARIAGGLRETVTTNE